MNKNNKQKYRTSLNEMFYNKKTKRLEKIDNRLVRRKGGIENVNNKTKIQFNDLNSQNELLTLQEDSFKLSIKLLGKKEQDKLKFNSKQVKQLQDKKVVYEEVFEDSDIEYEILDDRKIKENIVIKKNNKDHYEYQYLISLENLTLKQNKETQELLFVDEKEKVIYSMLEPIMLDSNDSSSNDMNYDVKQLEENQYLLTIKADSNWINSEERVLPIYLDPTLQIQGASFARWYLIEKYRSVTEILTSGDFTAKINRDQIQVMEFDDTMLNEMVKDGTITSIYFWLIVSNLSNGVKLIATKKTLDEIKSSGIPSISKNDTEKVELGENDSYERAKYFYKCNLTDHYYSGRKRFIVTKDYDNSYTFPIELTIYPKDCDYHVCFTFEPKIDINSVKKHNWESTQLNDKLSIQKCLLSKEFKYEIIDLNNYNKINLKHIYSDSNFLPVEVRDTLFSQYGNNFRLNYSFLLYDGTYQNIIDLSIEEKGNFVLIDPNDNIKVFSFIDKTYTCKSDLKQTLSIDGEDIVITTPSSKMTFVKSALKNFYLLKSIHDLVYGQHIIIEYNADKITISSIKDERDNTLNLIYGNNMLTSIEKSNSKWLKLEYDENKELIHMEYYSCSNNIISREVNIEHGYEAFFLKDSLRNVDTAIYNNVNTFEIYDYYLGKHIKKIKFNDYYRSIINEFGETQVIVFDGDKISSSYKLKTTSTEDNLLLYSNVNFGSYKKTEVEEENTSKTTTEKIESGTLNINKNNLITDSQFNCDRYECDLFNGKNPYYLSSTSQNSKIIECMLTEAQSSRLVKGFFYTFGMFIKTLTENVVNTNVTIKLIDGSNELVSKTFTKIKPVWDFKFLSLKYYEHDNTISSLKIRIEISGNSNDILFANPILRKDESYSTIKSVSSYNEDKEEYETITTSITNGFEKIQTSNVKGLLIKTIINDLHKNERLSEETISYDSNNYQPKSVTYASNTILMNKNKIENIYSSNKLEKTNVYSTTEENTIIQNKYNFDSFGNSNPIYDEREFEIQACQHNADGTISTISTPEMIDVKLDYVDDDLKKIYSSDNTYSSNFEYENGVITKIDLNGKTNYLFNYDYENMSKTVKVNGTLYNDCKLERGTNRISIIEQIGAHFERKHEYNLEGNLTSIYENNSLKTMFLYNILDQVVMFKEIIDDETNIIKRYYYSDEDQETIKTIHYDGYYDLSVTYNQYDFANCSQSVDIVLKGVSESYKYTFNNNLEKIITKIEYPNTTHEITYNGFGDIVKQTTTNGDMKLINEYLYEGVYSEDGKERTSHFVEIVLQKTYYNNIEKTKSFIDHAYNRNGSLAYMNVNGEKSDFTYDTFGRLKKEKNSYEGMTKEYTYDNNGNITQIKETDNSNQVKIIQQTFNNTNELQSINYQNGAYIEISYDEIGNPILISKNGFCASGSEYETENITLTYEKGNRLSTYGSDISFKYDLSGIRIAKKVGNELHKYFIHNDSILREEVSNNTTGSILYTLDFFYDETGVCAFKYGNEMYYYQKDLTGSIIGIYNTYGEIVAKYRYDAWGNHKVYNQLNQEIITKTFIGHINPFRYKGYFYDVETGLFYCNSRYYSPELCRWLTPDSIDYLEPNSINGLNLYAYCGNNPVMCKQGSVSTGRSIITSSTALSGSFLPTVGISGGSSSIFNQTIKGSFRTGLLFGSGSITGLYADWNARAQISLRKGTFKLGIAGKFSLLNVSGQIGFGTDDLNLSLKAIGDIGTVTGMAGIFIDPKKNNYFVGIEAKATALSGRIGGQLDIFGVQIEVGLSGELGSIGGRLGVGLKPNADGQMEFYFGAGLAVLVGWDFYIRIRFDELFR